MNTEQDIVLLPISQIRVLNPREREKTKFAEIISSISKIGLKKPVTVRRGMPADGQPDAYDLVCGQGRLEAFKTLEQESIPAFIIEASREDCLLMSLIENIARKPSSALEQMGHIGWLKQQGYTNTQIANKTDLSISYVGHVIKLLDQGEERLLAATMKGQIPMTIALEISETKNPDHQRELMKAYEQKKLPKRGLITIRRLLEERSASGKSLGQAVRSSSKGKPTAARMVSAYHELVLQQKQYVKKASLVEGRLEIIITAMKRLLKDENFLTLLRAEGLMTLPVNLAERIEQTISCP